ncbi:MAG TPA: S9 family peptidase [Chthoniobacterales bacterium]|nr:S9 family peptidase [Chthoniobacterales bacterium]
MSNRILCAGLLFFIYLTISPLAPAAPAKRSITEKDLFAFVWLGHPQLSPDGTRVAYVRVTVNEKKDGYDTSIWMVPTVGEEPARQLTSGPHDAGESWSPDGKYLVFSRAAAEKEGKKQPPQLCLLPMAGGDAFVFTDLPKGAGDPIWSPDGKSILFTSTSNPEDLAKQARQKKKEEEVKKAALAENSPGAKKEKPESPAKEEDEQESDVHVITQAVYRDNDEGYLDPKRPQHLWLVTAPRSADEKVEPRQLTSGRFDEGNAFWSKDGARIYFTSLHVDEPYYELPKTELYALPAKGGNAKLLTTIPMGVRALALSPDGKRAAFIAATGEPVNSYTQPDLWTIDLTPSATPVNLTTGFDFDVGDSVFGDNAAPRGFGGGEPIWSEDGKSILEIYSKEGRTQLASFNAENGAVTDLTHGNQAVLRYSASADGTKIVYLVSTPTQINDLFFIDQPGAEPRQLTHSNDALFGQLNLTEPEEIWYESFDGKRVQAWVQKPPGFDPTKKYPLILNIHGGPHAAYGYIFEHEFQWMAAQGYVVLYPNPRGSTSYGQMFGNIIQYKYPGDDFKDLMAGVDEVVRRGGIDEKKMGVTGGSGGGLLTDWVVGQTDRFAAAVAQRDIADWADWWYTADFTLFQANWFKTPPFEDKEGDYKARSPITYINNVKTPLMLVLGEDDSRTPPGAGGEQMFRALKFRKIPTVMVKFPGETHELSRSGQPWHRIERLDHIVGWFDHWLKGIAKPEYEVAPKEEVSAKKE